MVDILIKNGLVFLNGKEFREVNVGVLGDKIIILNEKENIEAVKIINAENKIVSPGFIDMHSHDDFALIFQSPYLPKTYQGVTTEITGNCGISGAPLGKGTEYFLSTNSAVIGEIKDKNKWENWNEFIEQLERAPLPLNVVPFVGHGNLMSVFSEGKIHLEEKNLKIVQQKLIEIMESGCFGLSTGLIYVPGMFSTTEELISLTKIISKFGGIYSSHIRGEGKTLIEAVGEVNKIVEETGVSAEISHLKAAGIKNWNKIDKVIEIIEKQNNINFDVYPYIASSTHISALLPPFIKKSNDIFSDLQNKEIREKVKKAMLEEDDWENYILSCGPEKIFINSVISEKNKEIEGKNLKTISDIRNKDVFDCVIDIFVEEKGRAGIITFSMSEENVKKLIKHKKGLIGTDGLPGKHPHPRLYGTFPRILNKYVRDEKLLSLEEALYKFTKGPAEKIGLKRRGEIKDNYFADIVIFDPEKVKDKNTFESPEIQPEGILYVIVNGEIEVEDGKFTGKTGGKVLKKNKF
ncbi:MAG TPA: D-aminoacylase [bacterium]|nr:D-aminoacylase [bacterium]